MGNENLDIQYGYTGTRADGMVLDYAQDTPSNVQIDGFESLHGEANGDALRRGRRGVCGDGACS